MMVPFNKKMVVLPFELENTTKSGLIIVGESHLSQFRGGLILSVGDLCENRKVGDKIIYSKLMGITMTYEGKNCMLVDESEVYLLIENDELKAYGNNLLAYEEEYNPVLKSGFITMDDKKKLKTKPNVSVVHSVGEKCVWVKPSDRVFYSSYSGVVIKYNDDEVLLLRETEVIGKCSNDINIFVEHGAGILDSHDYGLDFNI